MANPQPKVLVAFTTSNDLYARFIRYVIKAVYHHAMLFIYLEDLGGWYAIEIDADGVHIISTKKAFKRISKFKCFECTADLQVGISKTHESIGLEYDWKGLFFGLLFVFLKRFFGFIPDKPVHSVKKMYCIEYVATVLQAAGVPSYKNVDPASIPPCTLYRTVCNDSMFTQYDITKEELLNDA
jgi:hypothetical protein